MYCTYCDTAYTVLLQFSPHPPSMPLTVLYILVPCRLPLPSYLLLFYHHYLLQTSVCIIILRSYPLMFLYWDVPTTTTTMSSAVCRVYAHTIASHMLCALSLYTACSTYDILRLHALLPLHLGAWRWGGGPTLPHALPFLPYLLEIAMPPCTHTVYLALPTCLPAYLLQFNSTPALPSYLHVFILLRLGPLHLLGHTHCMPSPFGYFTCLTTTPYAHSLYFLCLQVSGGGSALPLPADCFMPSLPTCLPYHGR